MRDEPTFRTEARKLISYGGGVFVALMVWYGIWLVFRAVFL